MADASWAAPPLAQLEFPSWDAFFAHVRAYSRDAGLSFTRRSATSVRARNEALLRSPGCALLPERFADYARVLQCAARDCPARLNAVLQRGADGEYRVRVTRAELRHNHAPLGAAKRRRVHAEDAAPRAPSMDDVRAFLRRVEATRGAAQSVEERLAAYVNEFDAQEGNAAKIFVDDEKVLSSITLQTKHMRKVFEAFPEVLRVDGASTEEKKTESNYRVFSLMAHDTLGSWQYVQHAIVENDRSETLRAALDQFKVHNAHHSRIRALIVPSEDSVQLEELRANFPAARVLYSQFHVVRALHKAIAEHGKDLTSWHRDRLTGIAQLLVYAPTPVVYGANIAVMAEVLGSKQHPFFCFFLDKWDSCRDRWSTFAREGVTTFSISENDGQFAPTWRSIFTAANGELALDETVAAIRYYQAVVERAFIRDLNLAASSVSNAAGASSDSNNEYDAEMRLLAATVSPAASSLIFPQYRYAISRGAYQFCEPSRGSFFVSAVAPNDIFCDELSKEFCVEAERRWQCSCAFMVNHHLPCRHVFYIRRIVRCSCVIPVEHIEPRWVLAKAQDFFNPLRGNGVAGSGENGIGLDQDDHRHVVAPPGAWQKFVTAQEVGKRISQRMMEMDPEEFDRALHFYNLVETTLNVRPFDLNSAAVARLNSEGGRFVSQPAQRRPNWVEPDPTRTLAPRAVVGRMYASANDRIAAEVAAGTFQQAQLTKRSQPNRTGTQSAEVIDLQGESEEEEKENSLQQGDAAGDETQRDQEHGDNGVQHLQAKSGPVEQLESLGGGQTVASTGGDVESNTADQNTTHNDSYADEVGNTVNQSEPNSSNAVPDDRPGREPWEGIDDPDNYSEMHEAKATSPPRSPGFAN